jgi:hypothetical protein
MFAQKQPDQLRQKRANLQVFLINFFRVCFFDFVVQREVKLKHLSAEECDQQSIEIITALKQLGVQVC